MKAKTKLIIVATLGAVTMVAAPALAQEEANPYLERAVAAPKQALEISIAPGYSQPVGDIARGASVRDIAGPGGSVQLGVGYRVAPRWMIGLTGSYAAYGDGNQAPANAARARAMTTGIEGVFHGLPYRRIDPFLSLGMGWRGMWERNDGPGNDVVRHGLSVARLGVGVDFRVSRDVALAPVVAADANIFLWQDRADVTGSRTIGDPRLNFFLSAGLQGRFDLGGERVDRTGKVVSTTTTTGAVERGGLLKPTGTLHGKGGEVYVSEEIAKACQLHFNNDAAAPKFDFDESEVLPQDRDVLAQVAACVTTGPLKGRALGLIGRADPRGEEEYNMALGGRRAQSIQSYLSHLGVESARMLETSRGELDATGTDEAGWQHDRRVDILLR